MVLALLAGRKTQTRRLGSSPLNRCEVGDRLYVREHWKTPAAYDDLAPSALGGEEAIMLLADGSINNLWSGDRTTLFGKHRQGMHMPRWASRLTLIVEGMKVEPLQAIREADAIAEGLIYRPHLEAWAAVNDPSWPTFTDPRRSYRGLWDHLHTKPGERWNDNPEVVALTFRVVRGNIDQVANG